MATRLGSYRDGGRACGSDAPARCRKWGRIRLGDSTSRSFQAVALTSRRHCCSGAQLMSWLGQNVDLGWSATLIRLATGAVFLPHPDVNVPWPGTIAFFQAAGFKPPPFWIYVASASEAAVALYLLS